MSRILYYSRYCPICTKYLQDLSKMGLPPGSIHYICIDKRVKEANNQTYIVLENGSRIILPETVTKVPALMLLDRGYKVLYGDAILQSLVPERHGLVAASTQNHMEPDAFALVSGDIISDQYSFLDQSPGDMLVSQGNGGLRQMHNYVDLDTAFNPAPNPVGGASDSVSPESSSGAEPGKPRPGEEETNQRMQAKMLEMKAQRDADLAGQTKAGPYGFGPGPDPTRR